MKGNRLVVSLLSALLISFLLFGCGAVDISRYADNRPQFDLFDYFSGDVRGWGLVQDRRGQLLRHFVVDIQGEVNVDDALVLTEDFVWSDGENERRIWTITRQAEGEFTGVADDVIGQAVGLSSGNALNWSYDLRLKIDGSNWKIAFDDWMFLQPDGVLLNRATMKKFGFKVGEITIAFQKRQDR